MWKAEAAKKEIWTVFYNRTMARMSEPTVKAT